MTSQSVISSQKSISKQMNERVIIQLLDLEAMVRLKAKRCNLSTQRFEGNPFPFLKLEKESVTRMIIEMICFMTFHKKIPNIWKMGKTILIYKTRDINDPGCWPSITLISAVYRIIFGKNCSSHDVKREKIG
jgi:hypothetical protein